MTEQIQLTKVQRAEMRRRVRSMRKQPSTYALWNATAAGQSERDHWNARYQRQGLPSRTVGEVQAMPTGRLAALLAMATLVGGDK